MAMSFFENQEAARSASRRMIVLFAIAVVSIVLAVDVALAALYFGTVAPHGAWARSGLAALPPHYLEATTAVVLLFIVGGTAMQINELRAGGEAVAQMVGARPVDPGTRDPLEKRLQNVVAEMALASGIPAPRVYVLDGEPGINAFAAGNAPADAVVTVTEGTLRRLNRDELQGVVGHEFSHILNGDIGLNLRLIGVLHGLLLLALFGRFLANFAPSRGRDRDGNPAAILAMAGLVMLALGYIGVFFGRLIKASVARQREYLADASSVQFTRNPDGIGGALRKIGGLSGEGGGVVEHLHAESLSHMFMAPVSLSLAGGMLASHPPLEERIRRVYGRPMEYLPAPAFEVPQESEPEKPPIEYAPVSAVAASALLSPVSGSMAVAAAAANPAAAVAGAAAGAQAAAGSNAGPADLHHSVGKTSLGGLAFAASLQNFIASSPLQTTLGDARQVQYLALAMLFEKDGEAGARQVAALDEFFGAGAAGEVDHLRAQIAALPPGWRLALLDLAMPALRTLDAAGRDRLLHIAHVLIAADGRVTLAEFLLFSVLRARLKPPRGAGARPGPMLRLEDVAQEAGLVLSLVATVRLPQDAARAYAEGAKLLPSPGPLRTGADLALAQVGLAFDRLAQLAPLQKPALVKACIAAAFIDGSTHWKAASCLRTLCAALDCPLPPQVEQAEAVA